MLGRPDNVFTTDKFSLLASFTNDKFACICILIMEHDCWLNIIIFKKLEHVTITSGCGNIRQSEHWLVVNQPVLPLMDITTTTDDSSML